MKRGVVELSLVWILVAIVGALLLGFFFQVTTSLNETSNKLIYNKSALTLRNIFLDASSKPGLVSEIDLPIGKNVEVNLNKGKIVFSEGRKILGESSLGKSFVFFDKLESGNVKIWSEAWEFPFRVDRGLNIEKLIKIIFYNLKSFSRFYVR